MRRQALAFIVSLSVAALVVVFSSGAPLAEDADPGQTVFMAQKCNMCHAVSSAGIEAKSKSPTMAGPDLTGKAAGYDEGWVEKYLMKQAQLNDKDHKKEFKGTEEELGQLTAWLGTQ
jgi:cytochrome c2